MVERNVRDTMGKTSRPLSDSNTISRARNRAAENHRAAENLWGQSASQRAGVANSLEKPASLVSKQKLSQEVDRERKRQLINKMVRPETYRYESTKGVRDVLLTLCFNWVNREATREMIVACHGTQLRARQALLLGRTDTAQLRWSALALKPVHNPLLLSLAPCTCVTAAWLLESYAQL
jgi:hypothetical protein